MIFFQSKDNFFGYLTNILFSNMRLNEPQTIKFCSEIIQDVTSILNMSELQVLNKYKKYPILSLDSVSKGDDLTNVEIRFDEYEFTLTCSFDESNRCVEVYLFLDNEEVIDDLFVYLNANYGFIKDQRRFVLPNCNLEIQGYQDCPIIRICN